MARPCSRAAALALLALAALLGVAAGQQAVPATGSATPAGGRDPANIFHWDTLSLGQAPAAATIPQIVITFPLAPAPAPVSYAETYASSRSSPAAAAPSPEAPSPDAGADNASDESSDGQDAAPAPAPAAQPVVVGTGQLPQRPGSAPQRPGPPQARPTKPLAYRPLLLLTSIACSVCWLRCMHCQSVLQHSPLQKLQARLRRVVC